MTWKRASEKATGTVGHHLFDTMCPTAFLAPTLTAKTCFICTQPQNAFFLAQLALQGNRANGKKSLPGTVPDPKKRTKMVPKSGSFQEKFFLLTVEVPTCDTGFLHEKWPLFWGSSKLIFFENVSCNRPSWYKTYQLSGSHSVEALSPKKSICGQKAINFSIPTKIVVAARQNVKSQLHLGKQPTKNQAVKIGQPRTWPYHTPKRDVRATTWKKRQQRE